jgi:hypothetical protein
MRVSLFLCLLAVSVVLIANTSTADKIESCAVSISHLRTSLFWTAQTSVGDHLPMGEGSHLRSAMK